MRLTLDEYSKHFKMSKEMINSKLRTKRLNYIIEDGVTYIIVTSKSVDNKTVNAIEKEKQAKENMTPKTTPQAKAKTTVAMVLGLYQKENQQLKEKIVQLEAKIDKLIDDKEQMLRDEMSKIEQVYSAKDEQLKSIIELINVKLIQQPVNTIHEVETLQEDDNEVERIVELKDYLKTMDLESYQKKIIKKRFAAEYGSDIRIIKEDSKIYLNFSKYDYSDLLDY